MDGQIKNSQLVIWAPVIVVLISSCSSFIFSTFIQEWAWIPVAIFYWGSMFAFIYFFTTKKERSKWLSRARGHAGWKAGTVLAGLFPLTILFTNMGLLRESIAVTVFWLLFALVNPFFEEGFWRGLLLDKLPFATIHTKILYSTVLFIVSHPLLWGIFSIANRSYMLFASLLIMSIVWSYAYYRIGSLRWPIFSHFLVDIGNLSVFTFLNLYIPPAM
ncbi:MAG TPA: CPBP family intramembrane glutamic endopeptidase [Bacillus sp. (in: firmicutes)]|uniref:CPBP family intramembrane glutamic endopeptidase n=1 Tax=Bacillus litorisediminis TaxID=2922713 RepID=UPI001FB04098|nr:CPBP family intramembrane glutamic endopeptidase [Bacillus litorisediminis]HWO75602.1 CPBP family intramembrane glutamic endopeptidase [Bacillus sp. (in: firmicutes)]